MDRREFLSTKKRPTDSVRSAPARPQSGLNPYTGSFTSNELQHLLKRTMFGSAKTDLDYFKSKTLEQVVNELLT
ncbi:MAG: hypothetical protein WKF70_04870, partial [Chitinophagaceae bacterium]